MPVSLALPTCFPFTARLAWLSASCVLVLILLGTLITTYRVGMVDPIWPTEPWFLLGIEWNQSAGFFIEHIHRVAGYFAGLFILATPIAFPGCCYSMRFSARVWWLAVPVPSTRC